MKTLKKVKVYTDREEFTPEQAKNKSLACYYICIWVLAVVEYVDQFHMIEDQINTYAPPSVDKEQLAKDI